MKSIRSRLAATLLTGFIALLGAASILIFFVADGILEADFDSRLFAQAQAALASVSQKGDQLDVDWAELPQEMNPRRRAHDAIQIFDSAGRPFFHDSELNEKPVSAPARVSYRNVALATGHFRVLTLSFVPRVEEEDVAATPEALRKPCLLVLATDRLSLDHSRQKLAVILGAMVVATSLLSFLLVWTVLRRELQPLEALGDAVVNIGPESLGQMMTVDHLPMELLPIAVKLNDLLSRLEGSFARERRFNADISHELRTPVAELKTLSEVMLQDAAPSDEIRRAFEHTYHIACQMEALVTVLLEMVRNEEGREPLLLAKVDLVPLIHAARASYEVRALKKKIVLEKIPDAGSFQIESEPRLLNIIFANLFDNAVEYSPSGSRVEISLNADKKSPHVTLTNTANNLTASDLPHLFERFWRKDKARGESSHFGIGLALTRTLCQRLGIHLTASMERDRRLSFRLYLPTKDVMKAGLVALLLLPAFGLHAQETHAAQARTLDALAGEVLAHNPELKGVEADVAAAKGARRQAGAWKNPDLSVMYADRGLRMPGSDSHGFSDSIGITQSFEFPGKATLRKALADQDIVTAEIGVDQFRQALIGRVRVLGYRYAFAEQNREAADLAAGRARILIALLNKRSKAGLQAMFDAGALQGNLAELLTSERELDQEALSVRAEINLLRGWPAETPLQVVLPTQIQHVAGDFNALLLTSLSTSPVLKLKEIDLARNKNKVAANKLNVAPDFAIQPYYSLDKADDHDRKIGASLTVTLPIWDQNQGNIASAQANLVKAEATQQQAREDLQLSLTQVYQTQQLISRQLKQIGPDTVQQLARLAELADRHYRLGAINLQTFLEAQRQYLATARSVHQAMLDEVTAASDVYLLSGTIPMVGTEGTVR